MQLEALPLERSERIELKHLATKVIDFYEAFCEAAKTAAGYFTVELASEWRETEWVARGLLDDGVQASELEGILRAAVAETLRMPSEAEAADAAVARFVHACVRGVNAHRGESLGVTVADDELARRWQKRSWRRFGFTGAGGVRGPGSSVALVGRVIAEFESGAQDGVELWPRAADRAMEQSLADALAAARDHALHRGPAHRGTHGTLRIYFGGYPWPFVPPASIYEDLAVHGMAGRSLGLPIALAMVRALEGDRSAVGDHAFLATGDIRPDGRVRRVAKMEPKVAAARQAHLPLLCPAGQLLGGLRERSQVVSTLESALEALGWDRDMEATPSVSPPRIRHARATEAQFGAREVLVDQRLRAPKPGRRDERVLAALRSLRLWAESPDVLALMSQWDDAKQQLAHLGYELQAPGEAFALRRATTAGAVASGDSYVARFAALSAASDPWDFRRGKFERFAAGASLPSSVADETFLAAVRLGMRQTVRPAYSHYECAVVLGGARRAPFYRVHWVAKNLAQGRISADAIVLVGSQRKIDPKHERPFVEDYAPAEALTEFDLLHYALLGTPSIAKGLSWEPDETGNVEREGPNGATAQYPWTIRRYRTRAGSPRVYGVVAPLVPTTEPRTTQSLRFLHEQFKDELPPKSRVLLATSMIYVPYQQVEGMRALALPHDLIVDTTGHPNTWTADVPVPNFRGPGQYLQEIRSTLQACARLAADYPAEAGELVDVGH